MTKELDSFEDAAKLALAEMEEATSVDPEPAQPAGDEEAEDESGQADPSEDEQPESQEQEAQDDEESDPEEESLFSDVEAEGDEQAAGPVSIEDLDPDTPIDLGPGHEPKTLRELADSGLRLDDYTRKTQEVSEQRKTNERAIKFWEALQSQPMAVAKQIAQEAGLIEEGSAPIKAVEFAALQTADEVEAEIEKRVEERLAEHPDVLTAKQHSAMQTINTEFDRLERVFDTPLNEASRKDILVEAKRRGVADLELVTESMLAKRERTQAKRDELRGAAPNKATGNSQKEAKTEPASSFEEAAERALLELGLE